MRLRCLLVVLAVAVVCVATPGAQDGQDRPRRAVPGTRGDEGQLELRSDLVTLTVSVTNQSGQPVTGLRPESFRVLEDDVPQKIEFFEPVNDPYSLLLMLDTSGSTINDIDRMRSSAGEFVNGLSQTDRLGIGSFSRGIQLPDELTSNRILLVRHVNEIGPTRASDPGSHRFDSNTGTSLYDALVLALSDSPVSQDTSSRRRAVILFSDCVDSTSTYDFEEVIAVAERSGISVYVVLLDTQGFSDRLLTQPDGDENRINFSRSQLQRFYNAYAPDSPDRDRDPRSYSVIERLEINRSLYQLAREQAEELAKRSGGRVYPVATLAGAGAAYRAIASELRTRYSIGYYPTNNRHDGTWRRLAVSVPRAVSAVVVTRPGYWAPKE